MNVSHVEPPKIVRNFSNAPNPIRVSNLPPHNYSIISPKTIIIEKIQTNDNEKLLNEIKNRDSEIQNLKNTLIHLETHILELQNSNNSNLMYEEKIRKLEVNFEKLLTQNDILV